MPIHLQTRLLRVLQERQVLRLGASEPTPINIRVIAATHRNLQQQIARNQFREDLFYRLNVLNIPVPSLRQR
ncbi:MAG TPA: propionate catabolism operon regulatory protein PrpR, partial [Marinobacter hydrocarbonoclasticus]|nr:propionate catabolism operon regulatory protein PrpR [Marinobacter nauticus]